MSNALTIIDGDCGHEFQNGLSEQRPGVWQYIFGTSVKHTAYQSYAKSSALILLCKIVHA